MFNKIIAFLITLLLSVSLYAQEEQSAVTTEESSDTAETSSEPIPNIEEAKKYLNRVPETKESISIKEDLYSFDSDFLTTVYSGRDAVRSKLKPKTYELLRLGRIGTEEERLNVIKWCGRARVLFCFRLLSETIYDRSEKIRIETVNSLGFLRLEEGIEHLVKVLESEKNLKVRAYLIYALGASRGNEHINLIIPALQEQDDFIRGKAVKALGLLKDERALSSLRSLLNTERNERIRLDILHALIVTNYNDMASRKLLIDMIVSTDNIVRETAAYYIMESNLSEAYLPLKRALLLESNEWIRNALYKAFIYLKNNKQGY